MFLVLFVLHYCSDTLKGNEKMSFCKHFSTTFITNTNQSNFAKILHGSSGISCKVFGQKIYFWSTLWWVRKKESCKRYESFYRVYGLVLFVNPYLLLSINSLLISIIQFLCMLSVISFRCLPLNVISLSFISYLVEFISVLRQLIDFTLPTLDSLSIPFRPFM